MLKWTVVWGTTLCAESFGTNKNSLDNINNPFLTFIHIWSGALPEKYRSQLGEWDMKIWTTPLIWSFVICSWKEVQKYLTGLDSGQQNDLVVDHAKGEFGEINDNDPSWAWPKDLGSISLRKNGAPINASTKNYEITLSFWSDEDMGRATYIWSSGVTWAHWLPH